MLFPTPEEVRRWRMSLADEEIFGKNDADFEMRLPSGLKDAMAKKAAETGRSAASVARLAMALYLFGPEHVGILVARRYGLGQQPAPFDARTSVLEA